MSLRLSGESIELRNRTCRHARRHGDRLFGLLRPLIEAGKVVPVLPPAEFCSHCFGSKLANKDALKKRKRLFSWLSEKFLDEASFSVELHGEELVLEVSGPEVLIEHGSLAYSSTFNPAAFESHPLIKQKLLGEGK